MVDRSDAWVSTASGSRMPLVERLCRQGVRATGVDGAGVSAMTGGGAPHHLCSTDDRAALVEELQFTLGVGPCFEAASTGRAVLVDDLAARIGRPGAAWSVFAHEAVDAGIGALFAFPLGVGAQVFGTLDLYRATPGPLSDHQLDRSRMMADSVAFALAADEAEMHSPSNRLRMSVHQAAGRVMVQADCSIDDALLILKGRAYSEGVSVNAIAKDVLDGRLRFGRDESEG